MATITTTFSNPAHNLEQPEHDAPDNGGGDGTVDDDDRRASSTPALATVGGAPAACALELQLAQQRGQLLKAHAELLMAQMHAAPRTHRAGWRAAASEAAVEAEAAAEAARAQQVAVAKLAEALGQCHTVAPAVGSGNDPVSGSAAVVPAAPTRGGGGDTVAVNTAGGSAAVAPTTPAPGDGSGGMPVGGTAADALALDRCAALSGAPSYGEGLRFELHMMWVELRLLQHLDTALTGELVILRTASSAAFEAAKRLPCHSPGDWWCRSCGTRSLQTHSGCRKCASRDAAAARVGGPVEFSNGDPDRDYTAAFEEDDALSVVGVPDEALLDLLFEMRARLGFLQATADAHHAALCILRAASAVAFEAAKRILPLCLATPDLGRSSAYAAATRAAEVAFAAGASACSAASEAYSTQWSEAERQGCTSTAGPGDGTAAWAVWASDVMAPGGHWAARTPGAAGGGGGGDFAASAAALSARALDEAAAAAWARARRERAWGGLKPDDDVREAAVAFASSVATRAQQERALGHGCDASDGGDGSSKSALGGGGAGDGGAAAVAPAASAPGGVSGSPADGTVAVAPAAPARGGSGGRPASGAAAAAPTASARGDGGGASLSARVLAYAASVAVARSQRERASARVSEGAPNGSGPHAAGGGGWRHGSNGGARGDGHVGDIGPESRSRESSGDFAGGGGRFGDY